MKAKLFVLAVLLFLMLSGFSTVSAEEPIPNSSETQVGHLTFAVPVTISELTTSLAQQRLKVVTLQSSLQVGEVEVTEFYMPPVYVLRPFRAQGNSGRIERMNRILIEAYMLNRTAFLQDMLATEADLPEEDQTDMAMEFAAMREVLATPSLQQIPVNITGIVVTGPAAAIQNLVDSFPVPMATAETIALEALAEQSAAPTAAFQEASEGTTAANATWYPNSGTSYVYPSSLGGRYTSQYLRWTSKSFTSTQTYEHDFWLDNYDNRTYLDPRSTLYPACTPRSLYTTNSFPSAARPYVDTRNNYWGCDKNEIPYTIGVAQASALSSGKTYYTYFRTALGNASSDRFKLQAQLGRRVPTNCYSTWCSWGSSIFNLIPAWNTGVPGTRYWQK